MESTSVSVVFNFQYPEELMFLKNRKRDQLHSDEQLTNKTIVLTGATSGIGLSSAHRLATAGAHLILVVRNLEKGEALKRVLVEKYQIDVELVYADFERFETVREAAQTILMRYPLIDILINNAGIHSTKYRTCPTGYEQVLSVNHLSPFLFTQLLYPNIKKAEAGRIIFVNSEGHRFSSFDINDITWTKRHYTGLRSYGASKSAQLLSVLELSKRAAQDNVSVIAMHPGDVKSNIGQNNGWLYRLFSHFFIQPVLQDVSVASNAIHFLCADASIPFNSGKFYHLTHIETPAKHVLDSTYALEVYQQSCAWLKLENVI